MNPLTQTYRVEVSPGEWISSSASHVTRDAESAGRFGAETALTLALEFSAAYGDRVRLEPIWDEAARRQLAAWQEQGSASVAGKRRKQADRHDFVGNTCARCGQTFLAAKWQPCRPA